MQGLEAWQDMDGQFVVSQAGSPQADGTVRHALTTLALDTFGDTRLVKVRDATGMLVGVLIGTIIDCERRRLVTEDFELDVVADAGGLDALVERHIYAFAGSFLFILDCLGLSRLYLDANGSRPCIYEPESRRAASSAIALLGPDAYWARLQRDLYDQFEVGAAGWFSADLTAHSGLRRLLCNHYLDLRTWQAHRHWPVAPIEQDIDADETLDGIMRRVGASVEALCAAGEVSVALTAGLDSRFVMASCRDMAGRVDYVTVAPRSASLDVDTARQLTRRNALTHRVLPYRKATQAQAEVWQVRAGHCISGNNMWMHPSVFPLRGRYFVGGLGGEVGRGFLWMNADVDTPLDAQAIVARLKLPRHPLVVSRVEEWLAPLSGFDSLTRLDLAYLELRVCSWGFADAHANPVRTEIHPIISRANYAAMLSVPPEARRGGEVLRQAIARNWPELMDLPINRYGDWRDLTKKGFDIVSNPGRALRKLRQLALVGARSTS